MAAIHPERDPERPVYVISVAATLVSAHPRTSASTRTRACSVRPHAIEHPSLQRERYPADHLDPPPDPGARVNLAGIRILFELEERLGARILEALYAEGTNDNASDAAADPATSSRT